MLSFPLRHSRPVKVYDGEGSVQKLEPVGTLWADVVIQDNTPTLVVHAAEDVRVGDLVEMPQNLTLNS